MIFIQMDLAKLVEQISGGQPLFQGLTVFRAGDGEVVAKKDVEVAAKKDASDLQKQSSQTGFSISNFLQETKEELNKVVWPSRQQLISESLAVVLMVILSTTLIYLVDHFFAWAAGQVFR